jgi:hypothetical protein
MTTELVVGAPIWDRSWCLPLWFDSLEANVDKHKTGLVFVVPPTDALSREVIDDRATGYKFVEVLRDKHGQHDRDLRRQDNFATLAAARNVLLQHVSRIRPRWYLSWDSDFLIAPGVLPRIQSLQHPLTGVWGWLNRKKPQRGKHWDDGAQRFIDVEWNEPSSFTAMRWEDDQIAVHFDPSEWDVRAAGCWPADVILAWQLMQAPVYELGAYRPHPHGEDIPFNWWMRQRGIQPWCYAESIGLHLFDKPSALLEIQEGYPDIMRHTEEKPLAAYREPSELELLRVIGYYTQ